LTALLIVHTRRVPRFLASEPVAHPDLSVLLDAPERSPRPDAAKWGSRAALPAWRCARGVPILPVPGVDELLQVNRT